jgi:hypothetical protein
MTGAKSFSEAFKKLRLQSGIDTLHELCELLIGSDFFLEESTLSRWQSGNRIPKNRKLILGLIKIFAIRKAISTVEDANKLLYLTGLTQLSDEEIGELSLINKQHLVFILPPEPDIIGIEPIKEQVREELEQRNGHLKLVLWGLPGTGKSSAAISAAYQFQSFFQKGLIWIRVLDKDILSINQEIREILYNNIPEKLHGQISTLIKSKDLLIIFDNVNDESVFNKIINDYNYTSYIVTTYFQPDVVDRFSLIKVNSFDIKYAVELFSKSAGRALLKDEIKLISKISNQVGKLPLPLSIIANTLRGSLSKDTLLMTLNLIKRKQKGLPFFQENFSQIISAFELLFEQLSPDEKYLLRIIATKKLPIFQVVDLVSEEFDFRRVQWAAFTLCNKSLIDATASDGYRIHPVLYRFLRINTG